MPDVPTIDEIARIADPRERLIAAAARTLVDDGFRVLAAGLSPERIAAVAGRSRRTFYEHFATKEDFLREVFARHLQADEELIAAATLDEGVLERLITEHGGGLLDTITLLSGEQYSKNIRADSSLIDAISWVMAGSDPATGAALQDYRTSIDDLWEANVGLTLDTWAVTLRAPWTPRLIALALLALADGMFARTRSEASDDDRSAEFSLVLTTLIAGAIQPLGDEPEHLDDLLAGLHRAVAINIHERHDPAAAVTARRRVIDATIEALAEKSMAQLTMAEIADRAGVGLGTLRASFATMTAILAELVADQLSPIGREVDFDRRSTAMTNAAMLRRHLARLHQWAESNPALARAVSTALLEPSDAASSLFQALIAPTRDLLCCARESGEITGCTEVDALATMLTFGSLCSTLLPGSPAGTDWLVDLAMTVPADPMTR